MLRRFHTAVLEKNETYTTDFETEPMECGWASEATWFVRVTELSSRTVLHAHAQVSPDGLDWCDKEKVALHRVNVHPKCTLARPVEMEAERPGLYQLELRHFGGWLRLRCELVRLQSTFVGELSPREESLRVKLTIYLALKE